MKTALYFCLNSEYLEQFKVLVGTLRENGNVSSDADWFVFTPDDIAVNGMTVVKTDCIYETDHDGEPYQNCDDKVIGLRWLADAGYDQAVYMDCDMLVVGDISPLFDELCCDIAASKEYHYEKECSNVPVYLDTCKISNHYFNSGLMVVNLKSKFLFADVATPNRNTDAMPRRKWRDQEWLNWMFKDATFKELPKSYNWKPESYSPLSDASFCDHIKDRSEAKVIHFAGKSKPWAKSSMCSFWFERRQVPIHLYYKYAVSYCDDQEFLISIENNLTGNKYG